MRKRSFALIAVSLAVLAFAALFATLMPIGISIATQHEPRWEAVKAEVPVGKGVRLEVRLVGTGAKPLAGGLRVTSKRLDMGPDGMPTMTAPLRPIPSSSPGVLAFETDLVMAGRWALTVSAAVAGSDKPATGVVLFTAVEKRSEAAPVPSPAGKRRVLYYRNPMGHPDVSPVPKKDSMGMDYIPVYQDEAAGPAGTVRIAPEKIQRAGVRTDLVTRRTLNRTVRAVGTVVPDERRLGILNAKFDGFVEELFVPVTGAEVRAGERLMRVWIGSREILQKQSDYLSALRGAGASSSEAERAARNLRLFGISEQVIEGLRRTRDPVRSIVLRASADGTVMEKPAVNGMRFSAGDMLFRIADLSTVWVLAQVAERDLAVLRIAQQARIQFSAFAGEIFKGRIAFVYPELNLVTRTAIVRIEVPNESRRIKLGQYADVTIEAPQVTAPVIAIPQSAVIDSGSRRVAFVAKGDGVFEPRNVVLGLRGDHFIEIKDGLSEGERIVTTGNFLIDAESNLRAALGAFAPPAAQP